MLRGKKRRYFEVRINVGLRSGTWTAVSATRSRRKVPRLQFRQTNGWGLIATRTRVTIGKGSVGDLKSTVHDGEYRTPLGRFSMVDVSTAVGIVSMPKRLALETSRRELSEDVI